MIDQIKKGRTSCDTVRTHQHIKNRAQDGLQLRIVKKRRSKIFLLILQDCLFIQFYKLTVTCKTVSLNSFANWSGNSLFQEVRKQ